MFKSGKTEGYVTMIHDEKGYAFIETPEGSVFATPKDVQDHGLRPGSFVKLTYHTQAKADGTPGLAVTSIEAVEAPQIVVGTVTKDFGSKGYAFLTSKEVGEVFLGGRVYKEATGLVEGAKVTMSVIPGEKNKTAVEVHKVEAPETLTGYVRNMGKDFGFVSLTDGRDVLVHKRVLGNRLEQFVPGAKVTLIATERQKGLAAVKVLEIEAPCFLLGTVTNFGHKFGFVDVPSVSEEVYLGRQTALAGGAIPAASWNVEVVVVEGSRGFVAVAMRDVQSEQPETETKVDAEVIDEIAEVPVEEETPAEAEKPKRKPRRTRKTRKEKAEEAAKAAEAETVLPAVADGEADLAEPVQLVEPNAEGESENGAMAAALTAAMMSE